MNAPIQLRLLAALLLSAALQPARADSLDAILARWDRASKLQTVSADLQQTEYNAVLKDMGDPESAEVRVKRGKNQVKALIQFTKADPKTVFINGSTALIYYPKVPKANQYDLKQYSGLIDQFVLLAFGTSSSDLQKSYDVRLGGADTIDKTPTTRIELTPKTAELKKIITKIELWFAEGASNAMREKVTEPSGNYYLANYSNVKPNSVRDADVDFKLPKGVKPDIVKP